MGSGFFFWGMMELPVDTESPAIMNLNSSEVQSTHCSAMREQCMEMMAKSETYSRRKSRSETASRLLAMGAVKPSICAVRWRSVSNPVPASAQAPKGEKLRRARQSNRRSRSRSSCSTYARSSCCSRMGCARCRCVYPGTTSPSLTSASLSRARCALTRAVVTLSMASRVQSRTSVTTWSLRLRAVWSFLPGSPILSMRADSMFMCTSSRACCQTKTPSSISFSTSSSPARMAASSAGSISRCASSMVA
mmetsp:Transcript_26324/g.36374  ORF Transcript_26324/g.36374 Transcript_26324/m.36374 type:complete len:249 (-) Transcript_26324:387-1133(-)